VKDAPPYGDRKWHLYNLRSDPMESKDLAAAEPDRVKTMSATYADYVKKNGVIEVPDDYTMDTQGKKNAGLKH
jgi:arylsulfatase/uncharacterized sulfatase